MEYPNVGALKTEYYGSSFVLEADGNVQVVLDTYMPQNPMRVSQVHVAQFDAASRGDAIILFEPCSGEYALEMVRPDIPHAATISIAANNAALTSAVWRFPDGDGKYPAATSGVLTASISWSVEDGVLTITGSGAMPGFDGDTDAPWQVHAADITSVVIGEGIKSIGNSSFSGFDNLEQVSIPGTVTIIGNRAFSSADKLTQITIPDSVTSIGAYAFENTGIVSIDIPASVVSMACLRCATIWRM